MAAPLNVLILGASYGSLLGVKFVLAGHNVHLVCRTATAAVFTANGAIVRMPVKGQAGLVELSSKHGPGRLTASTPAGVDPSQFDLVALAMQEPQYAAPGIRELLTAIAQARVPCMSIMNMPPLPYLARMRGLDITACRAAYTDPSVWDAFDPDTMTLCSPDPQAFRPPEEPVNVLQVRLATNFKAARFASAAQTALLQRLEADVDAVRWPVHGEPLDLPVKLKVHESIHVPLAKWAMLIAGNYRCVGRDGMRSIMAAVHTDLMASQATYAWVNDLCVSLGAAPGDMVPFDKYAAAAKALANPSSAARALASGSTQIERVDRLVQAIAASRGHRLTELDETVAVIDGWLAKNRAAA